MCAYKIVESDLFLQHLPPFSPPDCDLFGSPGSPLIQGVPHPGNKTNSTNSSCISDDDSLEARHLLKEYENQPSLKSKKASSTGKHKFNRGSAYSEDEVPMISKAVMKNNTDSIRGNDKKAEVLWKEVWKVYDIFRSERQQALQRKNAQ